MPIKVKARYGAEEKYPDDANIPVIVMGLIHELETEKFDEPDDEHAKRNQ